MFHLSNLNLIPRWKCGCFLAVIWCTLSIRPLSVRLVLPTTDEQGRRDHGWSASVWDQRSYTPGSQSFHIIMLSSLPFRSYSNNPVTYMPVKLSGSLDQIQFSFWNMKNLMTGDSTLKRKGEKKQSPQHFGSQRQLPCCTEDESNTVLAAQRCHMLRI
ncbi:hypothetical protein FKM82_004741 [Ascaphus truei]